MNQLLAAVLCALSCANVLAQEGAPASAEGPAFRLHGRFVDGAGAPVEGVALSLAGHARGQSALPAPLEGRSDGSGAFALSFDVEPDQGYGLIARHSDYGDVAWRWPSFPPPGLAFEAAPPAVHELDLGTVTLRPLATLRGFLLDERGALLSAGWSIHVQERLGQDVERWREAQERTVRIDAETGQFEVSDLGAGPVYVTAVGDAGRKRTSGFVVTTPGRVTNVELVDTSPDPERRLRLSIGSVGGVTHLPQPGTVHALDAEGLRIPLQPEAGGRAWFVDGVPRGEYRLVVDDRRFERLELTDVRTGTTPVARLVGSAALVVEVVDEVTGASVGEYELELSYIEHSSSKRTRALRSQGNPIPEAGRYMGIVPEPCLATVRVEGRVPCLVDVPALAPGEVRALVFRVGRGVALEGRVVELDGTPLADAEVALTRGEVPGLDPPRGGNSVTGLRTASGTRSAWIPARIGKLRTPDDGSFRFEGLSAGRHTVSVQVGTHAIRDWVIDLAHEPAAPVELRMPQRGRLEVQLVPRPGVEVRGAMLFLTPTGWSDDCTIEPELWPTRTSVDRPLADERGNYRTIEVVSGLWDVVVIRPLDDGGEPVTWNFSRPALDVQPGEVERVVVDLEREWPTRVHLSARAEGAATRSGSVALLREGSAPTLESRSYVYGWRTLKSTGLGERVEWVVPGIYRVVVSGLGWRWTSNGTFEIGATEPAPIEVLVPLVSGSIRIVDEHGAPRAGLELEWWMGDCREFPVEVVTDALGCFEVTAPQGALQIAFTRDVQTDVYGTPLQGSQATRFGPAVVSLQWETQSQGAPPQPRDVVIPRAAQK